MAKGKSQPEKQPVGTDPRTESTGAQVEVPSLEEVVAAGYSLRAAHGIVAQQEALAAGLVGEDVDQLTAEAMADYDERAMAGQAPPAPPSSRTTSMVEIMSVSEQGFWRCGRHYSRTATRLDLSALKKGELERLREDAARKHLIVRLLEVAD